MENGGGCQDYPGNINLIRHIIKKEFQHSIEKPQTETIEIIDQCTLQRSPKL